MIDIQEVDWYRLKIFLSYNLLINKVIFLFKALKKVAYAGKIDDLWKKHLTVHQRGS
jgi:hypothetical protein